MAARSKLACVMALGMAAGVFGCNAILGINDPIHAEDSDAQPPDADAPEASTDQTAPDGAQPDGQPDQVTPEAAVDAPYEADAPAPLTASEIGAGDNHACAVMSDTTVRCWGQASRGALGNGDAQNHQNKPVTVIRSGGAAFSGARRIDGGQETSCAQMLDGTLTCWGSNNRGQFGNGTSSTASATADSGPAISGVTDFSVGFQHVCAVAAGSAFCWGSNLYRKVSPEQVTEILKPYQVANLPGVTAVTASFNHTCALHSGAVSCWGYNDDGQLGNNSTVSSDVPVSVIACGTQASPLAGVQAIAAGARHTCALLASKTVYCWGDGSDGALGTGNVKPSSCAAEVTAVSSVERIAAGTNHTCVISAGGKLWCWGSNSNGQIGEGSTLNALSPNNVLTDVTAVAGGDYHTCAVKNDGTVWCWGKNDFGQLGTGDNNPRLTPASVTF